MGLETGDSLSILTWNVAGWAPTCALISSHYGDLTAYLKRLQCDVFCIQESKVITSQLDSAPQNSLGARNSPGWQSYWAFNRGKKKGFNGVATFVREGSNSLSVRSATQDVLGEKDLDDEGRCLLTEHGKDGSICVINVYAPVNRTSDDTKADAAPAADRKLRFLVALSRRMEALRAAGRRVILVGDLNLTWRPEDCPLERRLLHVDGDGKIIDGPVDLQTPSDGPEKSVEQPLGDLAGTWSTIQQLSSKFGVPATSFQGCGKSWHRVSEPEAAAWLKDLVSGSWVDVFAEVHGAAVDRFTCWNQQRNLRYCNVGTRLDYAIIDRRSWEEGWVVRSSSELLQGGSQDSSATQAQAALDAATHFGQWHASATSGNARGEGLSLQRDDMRLNDSQFPKQPHTGLIYTPPAYSDHIPVSILLSSKACAALEGRASDAVNSGTPREAVCSSKETRACQPWLKQQSISSLFGAKKQKVS